MQSCFTESHGQCRLCCPVARSYSGRKMSGNSTTLDAANTAAKEAKDTSARRLQVRGHQQECVAGQMPNGVRTCIVQWFAGHALSSWGESSPAHLLQPRGVRYLGHVQERA